jgi:hypothetical protein
MNLTDLFSDESGDLQKKLTTLNKALHKDSLSNQKKQRDLGVKADLSAERRLQRERENGLVRLERLRTNLTRKSNTKEMQHGKRFSRVMGRVAGGTAGIIAGLGLLGFREAQQSRQAGRATALSGGDRDQTIQLDKALASRGYGTNVQSILGSIFGATGTGDFKMLAKVAEVLKGVKGNPDALRSAGSAFGLDEAQTLALIDWEQILEKSKGFDTLTGSESDTMLASLEALTEQVKNLVTQLTKTILPFVTKTAKTIEQVIDDIGVDENGNIDIKGAILNAVGEGAKDVGAAIATPIGIVTGALLAKNLPKLGDKVVANRVDAKASLDTKGKSRNEQTFDRARVTKQIGSANSLSKITSSKGARGGIASVTALAGFGAAYELADGDMAKTLLLMNPAYWLDKGSEASNPIAPFNYQTQNPYSQAGNSSGIESPYRSAPNVIINVDGKEMFNKSIEELSQEQDTTFNIGGD